MPGGEDRARFRNDELVLRTSAAVDRSVWDDTQYEPFLDELCGEREYQKEAIRTALRYLLSGEHSDLRELARKNYDTNPTLEACYGSWAALDRRLQLPEQLSGTIDLATGTGKSFVLYGLAAILLAHGVVDRVLVLCPSTTIEAGLIAKFRALAGDENLQRMFPAAAVVTAPRIISASQTITEGSICVENYHAILEHVGSSIRDSLAGNGARTLVLNDEAHHVANEGASKTKKWKEFLLDPEFGFRYIIGASGTCYVDDEYFVDVLFRYSLRQAMEDRYVKSVDYIAEMPRATDSQDKWQLIRNRHEHIRQRLTSRHIRPLTIVVTPSIARCEQVGEELRHFLSEFEGIDLEETRKRVLTIYSGAPDLPKLAGVDIPTSQVEWIVSVSMLNEGWDVKRVFQIVPHEERAFNSKLLIAQVLGRGLRVPDGWQGSQPELTVFNHDAWANNIRHLVNEVLERERRLTSRVIENSPYNFEIHQIDYSLEATAVTKPMEGTYSLFSKGYVDLATEAAIEAASVEFERAGTGERRRWETRIVHRTYSPLEIAEVMFERLEEADDPQAIGDGTYASEFPIDRLAELVAASLARIGAVVATDRMRQKFLQALGPLRRRVSETVRYAQHVDQYRMASTNSRPADSITAADLRRSKAMFYTDETRGHLIDEQVELFDEVTGDDGAGWRVVPVPNRFDFKTPLSMVIADSDNERRFIRELVKGENAVLIDHWIKSTATRFYEIDYAWKKGAHAKRGKFSPDFFMRTGGLLCVVETKGDEELAEPSEENRKKNEFALAHFQRINQRLSEEGVALQYRFTFLTPRSFNSFFQCLRDGSLASFRSDMDVALVAADDVVG